MFDLRPSASPSGAVVAHFLKRSNATGEIRSVISSMMAAAIGMSGLKVRQGIPNARDCQFSSNLSVESVDENQWLDEIR